jgi:hypothetical protein
MTKWYILASVTLIKKLTFDIKVALVKKQIINHNMMFENCHMLELTIYGRTWTYILYVVIVILHSHNQYYGKNLDGVDLNSTT